jgi:acyl-CoA reductase-like NAD-dependent aldehyde dehydrogenase
MPRALPPAVASSRTEPSVAPLPLLPTGLFLDGQFVDGTGTLEVRDPYSGEVVAEVATAGPEAIDRAVRGAAAHLPPLASVERARILERAAELIRDRGEQFAQVIRAEAGKPIRQARGEVARCVDTVTFAAVEARTLAGEMVPMDASVAGVGKVGFIRYAPIGVVGAITPFNFPLNLVAHKLAPAIAAGCPVVLKPADKTPLSALLLAEVFAEAGLPPGALAVVNGDGPALGGALVDHPDIAMISFTGSASVGWGIRERAPRKHIALELGNSTPVIVTEDADLTRAAAKIAGSGFTHAGQSCISVQRVYVHESVHATFLEELRRAVEALVVGDPAGEATDVGPVITEASRLRLADWITAAVDDGARIVTGGSVVGTLIIPTVLDGITPRMQISCDEAFGPVVGVAAYHSIDGAIALSNATDFGLQAGIFTGRVDAALGWAQRLEFAGVVINDTPTFRADQQPYGGIKSSGNTREGPRYAVRSMCEPRLVILDLPTP